MIVTSSPFWRAEAATSEPIQPEPTTATRAPSVSALAQRVAVGQSSAGSRCRSSSAPATGMRRGSAPVVSSKLVERELLSVL